MTLRTFETWDAFSPTADKVQAKPGDLQLVDAPLLPGRKAWQVRLTPQSTLWDAEQRVHTLTEEFIKPRSTWSFGMAIFVPTDRPDGVGWDATGMELHQGWHGPDLSYNGPAPGFGNMDNGDRAIVMRGGPVKTVSQGGGTFIQSQWGAQGNNGYKGPFANGISSRMPKGRWTWQIITAYLDERMPAAGWVEVEIDGKVAVPRTTVPTCYSFDMFVMPINGYRKGAGGVNNNTAIDYQWACVGQDKAEVTRYITDYLGITAPTAPVDTAAVLIDKGLNELYHTTITYPDWKNRVDSGFYAGKHIDPMTGTGWGRALAYLQRAKG